MRHFALALALLAAPAMAQDQGFASSGWTIAADPRPAPSTNYVEPCIEIGCRGQAWEVILEERGESPRLEAPAGGRAYRYFIDDPSVGRGLKIVRLEITADGRGTLTSSYPAGGVQRRDLDAAAVAAFDAALAESRFGAAEIGATNPCSRAGVELVFEGVANGQYKWVIEPCGGEAGLGKAVQVLNGLS